MSLREHFRLYLGIHVEFGIEIIREFPHRFGLLFIFVYGQHGGQQEQNLDVCLFLLYTDI